MKTRTMNWITILAVLAMLVVPLSLPAQDTAAQKHSAKHHHYQLVDMGTLGGSYSYSQTPNPPPRNINSSGLAIATADTTIRDPYAPNCLGAECLVSHAITWQNGVQTDLGALPGVNSSGAGWVNDHGDVIGLSENSVIDPLTGFPEIIGVLWRNGTIINLGTMGGNASYPNAINNRGEVVGAALNAIPDSYATSLWGPIFPAATQFRAVLWRNGVMHDLGTLGGNDAGAIFVNEQGQVAGVSYTNTTPNPTTGYPTRHPFFWENGKMTDIGTLGGTDGYPTWMNNHGQVVGYSNFAGDQNDGAFLWDKKGGIQNLGTLPGGAYSFATGLSDAGEVIGTSDSSNGFFGFFWKDGVMTNLGTVDGDLCSWAKSVNAKGQILVSSYMDCNNETHWMLWENGGPGVDLQTLVVTGPPMTLTNATFINDRGEMEGYGNLPDGYFHSVLLIPCDENHPDVAGCDYGLVEAGAAAPQGSTPEYAPNGARRLPQSRWGGRHHGVGAPSARR